MEKETREIIYSVKLDVSSTTDGLSKFTQSANDSEQAVIRQETAIKKTTEAIKAEEGSIAALRKSNQELTKLRNATSTLTEEGRRKIIEYNKSIDANNAAIKANVDAYTKQKMSIGDYTSGILNAIPGVGKFTTGISGVNAALKANPIGLVITLLFSLKEILSSNAVIADKISFIFSGFNKGLQNIIDTIVSTVSSLDKLTVALTDPIAFFSDLAKSTMNAAKEGYDAAEAMDAFGAAQARANQEIKLADIQITSLEKSLKDRTKSEKERIAIANQVADLEIKNSERRKKMAEDELANEQLRLKGKTLSGEEEAKLIDLQTAVYVAAEETKITAAQRTTRINILLAKEMASNKDDIRKADDANSILDDIKAEQKLAKTLELNQKELEGVIGRIEKRQQLEDAEFQSLIDRFDAEGQAEQAAANKYYDRLISNETKKLKAKKDFAMAEMGVMNMLWVGLTQLAGKNKAITIAAIIAQKVQAIANIISSTGMANAKAVAVSPLTFGQPWVTVNTIAGAAGIAGAAKSGADAISQINSSSFFEGGYTGRGNPRAESTMLGKRPYVYHKDEYITPSRVLNTPEGFYYVNKLETLRKKSRNTFSSVGFADGGFAQIATSQALERISLDETNRLLMELINRPQQPVLVVQHLEEVQNTNNQIIAKATA